MNPPPYLALLAAFLTAAPVLADEGGTIAFDGQIVELGCSITAVHRAQAGAETKAMPPHLDLQVAQENDACSRGYTAFTSDYGPLQSTDTDANNGVITLTYN